MRSHLRAARLFVLCSILALVSLSAEPLHADGYSYFDHDCGYTYDGGFGQTVKSGYYCHGISHQNTLTPGITWNDSFQSGRNTSSAQCGIGYWGNSTTLINSFAPGSGISQSAPDGGNQPATFEFWSGIDGDATGIGLKPMRDIIGWYNVPFTATITNGGFVAIQVETVFSYYDASGSREDVHRANWRWDTPGTVQDALSSTFPLPDLIPAVDDITGCGRYSMCVTSILTLTVKNDDGPVGYAFPDGFRYNVAGTLGSVPEPSSALLLLGAWLSALLWRHRRK